MAINIKMYSMFCFINTSLNRSLGGYALTTIDGKIAYYEVSAGADSAVPFSSDIKTNLGVNIYDYQTNEMACGNIRFKDISSYNKLSVSNLTLGSAALYYIAVYDGATEKQKWTDLSTPKIVDISQYSDVAVSLWIKSTIASGYSSGGVDLHLYNE